MPKHHNTNRAICAHHYTHQGHSSEKGVCHSDPACGQDGLDGSNLVVSDLSVHSPEREGWSNHGNEHKESHGDGLAVEVDHLGQPVRSDGALDVVDDSGPHLLGRFDGELAGVRDELFVGDVAPLGVSFVSHAAKQ